MIIVTPFPLRPSSFIHLPINHCRGRVTLLAQRRRRRRHGVLALFPTSDWPSSPLSPPPTLSSSGLPPSAPVSSTRRKWSIAHEKRLGDGSFLETNPSSARRLPWEGRLRCSLQPYGDLEYKTMGLPLAFLPSLSFILIQSSHPSTTPYTYRPYPPHLSEDSRHTHTLSRALHYHYEVPLIGPHRGFGLVQLGCRLPPRHS